MIRSYISGDELKLKPNEFSDFSGVSDIFQDSGYVKHTLDDGGDVKCILCWKEYEPRKYAIFFLMSDGIVFSHARALKKFLDAATLRLRPKTCITYSFDCDMLNRWHRFFGFNKQDEVYIEDKKFNKWKISWG